MQLTKVLKFLSVFLLLGLLSCEEDKGARVKGTVSDAANMTYYFDRLGLSSTSRETLTSSSVSPEGKLEISLPNGTEPGIYSVRIGAKSIELVFDGTEKSIDFTTTLSGIDRGEVTVNGAALSQKYYDIYKQMVSRKLSSAELTKIATEEAHPLVAFMAASRFFTFREQFADIHKQVFDRLKGQYPDLYFINDYANVVSQLEKAKARTDAMAKIKVGMDAPDIVLNDPSGKQRSLSDYKGKVVLLDFWASWCGPCRKANPHLVQVYNQYKEKGFDVFSVSLDGLDTRTRNRMDDTQLKIQLDRQKERWVNAIRQDNLTWDGHVSDLLKWDSKASAMYGVSSIPKTFLIDRDGKIAAVDPRYNLEEALEKVI